MPTDRYGLPLTTTPAARDHYVRACDLMFCIQPGARAAFIAALAEDPGFALAHIGAAQLAATAGDIPALRAAIAAAQAAPRTDAREASHVAFFALLLSGQLAAAEAAACTHMAQWPRDAVVMNHYATNSGVMNNSGRPSAKRERAAVMEAHAPHFGDDWWYLCHLAMAISETDRPDEARALAERALALNPLNCQAAHGRAHIAYESNEPDGWRPGLRAWLATCSREAGLHGHLSWHAAVSELHAGNPDAAEQLFADAVAPEQHQGPNRIRLVDSVQYLWRRELAGNPRDPARWQSLDTLANHLVPRPAGPFVDIHILLADAVAGNAAALDTRLTAIQTMVEEDRYIGGSFGPEAARGLAAFVRGDHPAAIAHLAPLLGQTDRMGGGSRAQHDIIEFTLLRACIETGRHDELHRALTAHRAGPGPIPVAGLH